MKLAVQFGVDFKPKMLVIFVSHKTTLQSDLSLSCLDLSVLLLVCLDTVADQDQDLAVCASSFVVCNEMQFVKHFIVNSDR